MTYSEAKVAGTLFFIAATQFVLGLVVAESLYPGYCVSTNYISDLGVGPSAYIFNSSVFLLGLLVLVGAYFLQRSLNSTVLTALLLLTAIGAMGVGVFTEHSGTVHSVVSLIAFLFGGLSAIASSRLLKLPFSILAVIMGLMDLAALILFTTNAYLGLGAGGMERMIVYPILTWGAGFGAHLIGQTEKEVAQQKP
jgi:hypothetical membrane protein